MRPGPKPKNHGGKRSSAGRPKGARTGSDKRFRGLGSEPTLGNAARVTRPALELLDRFKEAELPLHRLLRRMCDRTLPEEYRDKLAAIALPYCHAKILTPAQPRRIADLSDVELVAYTRALERGELLPPLLPRS
jgi:hypothetical protein